MPNVEIPSPSISRSDAPEFNLKSIYEEEMTSKDLKGKMVIINFCTTWTPACARELPELHKLQDKLKKKNVQFVAISLDEGGQKEVEPVFGKMKLNFPVLIGSYELIKEFGGIDVIPTTFIIEPDWKLVNRYTGQVDPKMLEAEIRFRIKDYNRRMKELAKLQATKQ
ncbi:MAG: TlpA disulfide reductase family protein [Verrucomicrobiota bacterium]